MTEQDALATIALVMDLWPKYGERLTEAERRAWIAGLLASRHADADLAAACVRGYWAEAAVATPVPGKIIGRIRDEVQRRRADSPGKAKASSRFVTGPFCLIGPGGQRYEMAFARGTDEPAQQAAYAELVYGTEERPATFPGWTVFGPANRAEQMAEAIKRRAVRA